MENGWYFSRKSQIWDFFGPKKPVPPTPRRRPRRGMGKRLNAVSFAFARAGLPEDATFASLTNGQWSERGVGRPGDATFAPLTVG